MSALNNLIIILVAVLVLVGVVAGIYLFYKSVHGFTGASGATATNPCLQNCTVVPQGCTGTNSLSVGFTGASCPSTCNGESTTVTVVGCVAPVCSSPFCAPQQALYSNVNSSNTIYQICDSGMIGSGFFTNPCPNPTISGAYLATLSVTSSNSTNSQLNPVFITTIGFSIYGTIQPVAPTGITAETIAINMTDSTVVDNPYLLYQNPTTGNLSFQRLSVIQATGSLTNAIWIYDTAGTGNLYLFSTASNPGVLQASNIYNLTCATIGSLFFCTSNSTNLPCGYLAPAINFSASLIYEPNSGLFQVIQPTAQAGNPSFEQNLIISTQPDPDLGTGYLFTNQPDPLVDYSGTCPFLGTETESYGQTRFYSISATRQVL